MRFLLESVPVTKARQCPNVADIVDALRGALAEPRSDAVLAHVKECPACASTRAWVEGILDAVRPGPLEEPPAAVVERAIDIVPQRRPGAVRAIRSRDGWSLAQLVHDTFATPLAYGIRSRAASGRRLLYRAGDADLDLEVSRGEAPAGGLRLTGQVLMPGIPPPSGLTAALWSNDSPVAHADADALGIFVFDRIPPGLYRLEVCLPAEGRGIRIDVDLREQNR